MGSRVVCRASRYSSPSRPNGQRRGPPGQRRGCATMGPAAGSSEPRSGPGPTARRMRDETETKASIGARVMHRCWPAGAPPSALFIMPDWSALAGEANSIKSVTCSQRSTWSPGIVSSICYPIFS